MKLGAFKSKDLTEAVENITAVFTGEDGCVAFVKFHTLLKHLDEQAIQGDAAAKKATDIVRQFNRLIKLIM